MRPSHMLPSDGGFLKGRSLFDLRTDTPGRDERVGFFFQQCLKKNGPVGPKLLGIPGGRVVQENIAMGFHFFPMQICA